MVFDSELLTVRGGQFTYPKNFILFQSIQLFLVIFLIHFLFDLFFSSLVPQPVDKGQKAPGQFQDLFKDYWSETAGSELFLGPTNDKEKHIQPT